jgi:hypothetical protein
MSNNDTYPGLMTPTTKGFVPGAGTARDSAMLSMNSNAQLQAQANNALSGGRLRRKARRAYRGGDANKTLPVPQFTMPYPESCGPGTGANSQIQANSQTSTQMLSYSALDAGATKMGGSRHRGSRRRSRKGGNPDWLWGCMSGGKKCSRKRITKKSRKSRKNRRSRKH